MLGGNLKKIMIFDDNKELCYTIKYSPVDSGCPLEFIEASSVIDALNYLKKDYIEKPFEINDIKSGLGK
jgi:hypothetical protein